MKRTKAALLTTALLAGVLTTSHTQAEVSANVGYTSEYYFRGILQKSSSASAGLDFEESGFYAGTWAADVGDGLEVDLYLGYSHELDNGLSIGGGFTGYYYTGEFDDTYEEFNFNLGYKFISLEYSAGTYDGFGTEVDYDFLALTVEHNGFYGTYGSFGDESDGDYFEFGYGTEIGGFDATVSFIFNSEELSDQLSSTGQPASGEGITFSLSKSFDL